MHRLKKVKKKATQFLYQSIFPPLLRELLRFYKSNLPLKVDHEFLLRNSTEANKVIYVFPHGSVIPLIVFTLQRNLHKDFSLCPLISPSSLGELTVNTLRLVGFSTFVRGSTRSNPIKAMTVLAERSADGRTIALTCERRIMGCDKDDLGRRPLTDFWGRNPYEVSRGPFVLARKIAKLTKCPCMVIPIACRIEKRIPIIPRPIIPTWDRFMVPLPIFDIKMEIKDAFIIHSKTSKKDTVFMGRRIEEIFYSERFKERK